MDYMIFQGFIKLILYLAHVNCTAQSNQLLSNSKVTEIQTLPNLYLARLVTLQHLLYPSPFSICQHMLLPLPIFICGCQFQVVQVTMVPEFLRRPTQTVLILSIAIVSNLTLTEIDSYNLQFLNLSIPATTCTLRKLSCHNSQGITTHRQ